jgi:uncharacterized membrane protein YeaQ/YmgE (transglycosylase-associated protein family)
MPEHVAQMGPMLLVAGLAVGWLSEAFARAGGYGLLRDMAFGIVGSVVVGSAASRFGFDDFGMLGMFLTGGIGAALLIGTQRKCWRSVRT